MGTMGPRPRLHEGRLSAGTTGGVRNDVIDEDSYVRSRLPFVGHGGM